MSSYIIHDHRTYMKFVQFNIRLLASIISDHFHHLQIKFPPVCANTILINIPVAMLNEGKWIANVKCKIVILS